VRVVARVTTTRAPNSGRDSTQAIRSRSSATCPITVTAGAPIPSLAARSAIVPTVATRVRWRVWVPHSTIAAGTPADIPPSMRARVTRGSDVTPM
jgi:hypothetical protein